MKLSKFETPQVISLEYTGANYAEALIEVALFCKENNIEADFRCNGFLFNVEPGCNLNEKLEKYYNWKNNQI